MWSNELQNLLKRGRSVINSLSAEEAGRDWALNIATYPELWALEQLIEDLWQKDQDVSVPLRVAKCLGQGPDVFWFQVRGKACDDVDHNEALDFMHAASRGFMDYRLELGGGRQEGR